MDLKNANILKLHWNVFGCCNFYVKVHKKFILCQFVTVFPRKLSEETSKDISLSRDIS